MDKKNAKKKDIIELIRLMTLQSEQIEPNISMFVQRAIVNEGKNMGTAEALSFVNQYIRKDIEKLLVPFDEMFSHDEIMLLISFYKEIKLLIGFYKSDVMRKFFKNGRQLFDPIYESYRQTMKDAFDPKLPHCG